MVSGNSHSERLVARILPGVGLALVLGYAHVTIPLGLFSVATPSEYFSILKLFLQVTACLYVGNLKRIAGSGRK